MSTFPPRAEVKSMGTRLTSTCRSGETPSSPPHERVARRTATGSVPAPIARIVDLVTIDSRFPIPDSLCLVCRRASHDRLHDLNVLDLVLRDRVRVIRQHNEIRELAGC